MPNAWLVFSRMHCLLQNTHSYTQALIVSRRRQQPGRWSSTVLLLSAGWHELQHRGRIGVGIVWGPSNLGRPTPIRDRHPMSRHKVVCVWVGGVKADISMITWARLGSAEPPVYACTAGANAILKRFCWCCCFCRCVTRSRRCPAGTKIRHILVAQTVWGHVSWYGIFTVTRLP